MNESALKTRLKILANEKEMTFNQIWKKLLLERFLARLSHSKHQSKFVLKGGLLLAQYLVIGRETADIDFSLRNLSREIKNITNAINEICGIPIEDGMVFKFSSIKELAQPHMEYTGLRVSLHAQFGTMKDKLQIDIGFGDIVVPNIDNYCLFEYKGKPIFEGDIILCVYPIDAIFSEKLESVVSRGATNSRMKDYHDLLLMTRNEKLLNKETLAEVVKATFLQRGTPLSVPIKFHENAMAALQSLWVSHLRGLGAHKDKLSLPGYLNEVISEINRWMLSNTITVDLECERAIQMTELDPTVSG